MGSYRGGLSGFGGFGDRFGGFCGVWGGFGGVWRGVCGKPRRAFIRAFFVGQESDDAEQNTL